MSGKTSNSRGVAILVKRNFEYKVHTNYNDQSGNLIILNLEISNTSIKLVNLYGPNTDQPAFYQNISEIIGSSEQDYNIVFSLALDPSVDANNYTNIHNPKARSEVLNTMTNFNLIDAFRFFSTKTEDTHGVGKTLKQARLDYFIVSNTLLELTNTCNVLPGYRSDHSIVELNLEFCKFVKEKGIWKFNCSLLKKQDYIDIVTTLIENEKYICIASLQHR